MESLSEKLYDFLAKIPKNYYLPIGLAVAGLIFLSIGLIQLGSSKATDNTNAVGNENMQATASANSSFGLLEVDVEGAVVSPGVYKLPNNARVSDGLIAAGGLSASADREIVAKTLNLAAKLIDGAKIYIPKVGDSAAAASGNTNVLGASTGLININTASEGDLDNLPGVGPVTAQKIISARPYSNVDDLQNKKIVSSSIFAKIKDLITVY